MKKLALVCGLLAMIAFIGCDDDKNTNGGGGGNNSGSSAGSIASVPAGQNSAAGAACDPNTFVQFCDGNKAVFCDFYDNVVYVDACKTSCIVTYTDDHLNYADCENYYGAADNCTKEGDISYECGVDGDGLLGQSEYHCQKWSDGVMRKYAATGDYCTECTDVAGGCVQKSCTGSDATCSEDLASGSMCYDGLLMTALCDLIDEDAMCESDEAGVFCY